jgi:hypothetical protein
MAITLTTPKTCRKCKGSGDYHYVSGAVGVCGVCVGAGVVEGDKATLAARKAVTAEHDRVYGALRALAQADVSTCWMTSRASDGLWILQANEPERAAKAIRSIEAGHPGVIKALADYYLASKA